MSEQTPEHDQAKADQEQPERDAQPDADADGFGGDAPERAEATADAVVIQRPGTVDQEAANTDAKRRNDELVDQGTLSDRGYIGSDASDLQG